MSLRIVVFATGKIAEPTLEALCQSQHQVVGLVTQPDRLGAGRHQQLQPMKQLALSHDIPVLQPDTLRTSEVQAQLSGLQADLFLVAAYGQLLPKAVLDMPRLGTFNIHASLLPKYRGATPIHAAVRAGDAETGITIIRLVPKLDAGPMLGTVTTPIGPEDTTGSLEARLANLAVPLTMRVLDDLEAGIAVETIQDESAVTHVGKLTKADGLIDWTQPAAVVECFLRAMQPWPTPSTTLETAGKQIRLLILAGEPIAGPAPTADRPPPGTIATVTKEDFTVLCGVGALRVTRLQPEGKRPMTTGEFLRGRPLTPGDRCGGVPPTG